MLSTTPTKHASTTMVTITSNVDSNNSDRVGQVQRFNSAIVSEKKLRTFPIYLSIAPPSSVMITFS